MTFLERVGYGPMTCRLDYRSDAKLTLTASASRSGPGFPSTYS